MRGFRNNYYLAAVNAPIYSPKPPKKPFMENSSSGMAGLFAGVGGLVYLALIILIIAGMWKLF